MSDAGTRLRTGLHFLEGRMSFNSAFAPMAANAYFLETSKGAILFDPSCGLLMRRQQSILQHLDFQIHASAH